MARRRKSSNGAPGVTSPVIAWLLALAIVLGILAWVWHNERQRRLAKQPAVTSAPATQSPSSPDDPAPLPIPVEPAAPPTFPPAAGIEPWSGSSNLFLGNPTAANTTDHNNFLLEHRGFTLSYNDSAGGPNWVSWSLKRSDTGTTTRARYFSPDPLLPPGFLRITHHDYTSSGFDRGHQCPHSDRDVGPESSNETFVMTNILPQAPTLNQKPWAALENYTRTLVSDGQTVAFQLAGGIGEGGTGSKGAATTIAKGRVRVPAKCWKVIITVPAAAAARPDQVSIGSAKVICVIMPNAETVDLDWHKYQTSIHQVEADTGYRFLTTLAPEVAADLKGRIR